MDGSPILTKVCQIVRRFQCPDHPRGDRNLKGPRRKLILGPFSLSENFYLVCLGTPRRDRENQSLTSLQHIST